MNQQFAVVVTQDDKRGTLYPTVYGPFAERADAEDFASRFDYEPDHGEGGYQGATVVPPRSWTDPAERLAYWAEVEA